MQPAKYKEVCEKMSTLLNQTVYSEYIYKPSIAYTNARTNGLCGTIYRVYVNNKDTELAQYLYLHECGHILYGHAKNMELRMDRFLLAKMAMAYKRISYYFPNYEEYLKVFQKAVFNIVMDFEVNSRMFSNEEWEFMNEKMEQFFGHKGVRGMWPEDYGYPKELTWNEYLTLILMDPQKFMEQLKDFLEEMCRQEGVEGEEENKVNDKLSEKQLQKLREIERQHGNGKFSDNRRERKGGQSRFISPKTQAYEAFTDMTELFERISSVLMCRVPRLAHNDIIYNYNRRKYDTNVLIPKRVNAHVTQASRLFILLDVSGSINWSLVNGLITVFKNVSDMYGRTVFVTWNTKLVGEWNIKEEIKVRAGGGTDIAPGIAYINEKYKPKTNDVFFVMSDFWDSMNAWSRELKKIKARKYGVNWNSWYKTENPGFMKIFGYAERK